LLEEGYIFGLDFIENNYSDHYTYGFARRANLAKYSAAAIMPVPLPKRNETNRSWNLTKLHPSIGRLTQKANCRGCKKTAELTT